MIMDLHSLACLAFLPPCIRRRHQRWRVLGAGKGRAADREIGQMFLLTPCQFF